MTDGDSSTTVDAVLERYGFAERHLSAAARAALDGLSATLRRDIVPLMADAWERAVMPDAVLDALVPLRLMDPEGVAVEEADSSTFSGFRCLTLARADVSVATAYTAQAGLFRTAIRYGGSAEQAARWDPLVRSFEMRGAFCLTEPDHGSDIAGGLATRARREGDTWTIDGEKRWIGGAATADVLAVFARDDADGRIKAFLVDRNAPGVDVRGIRGKVSLRPMQNTHIVLRGVRVEEDRRLHGVESWRDVAALLRRMRSDVAWIATGLQAGALDAALTYTARREQFGRALGGFQLVQEKLARMLGNVTSSLALVTALSARQDAGVWSDENSALAKMVTAERARETAALAREVLGGNGLLLEHDAARFFADAEAVYSYEGTHEINALIVGRSLTGASAFA
ncbi:acyl-CoA dehydrogenase family protein [Microbacterium marinilacus]|uniref:Acyl-CoA dehydrogenase family protein n=1 Tax=Microbacterium marinilacus TaxID=415209 RepID=A0ABP7BB44_9MICO|nr:acyl-CoA dehydrogenase family protein [Microbacterium marinilacus]MBY0687083.1 acyl-CoA dehydrogenase family protein [Microbacterium marinilacus]